MMRYFVAFVVALGLIFVLIFLIFRGGGDDPKKVTPRTLESYATTSAQVRMTIDGPINANSLHHQVQVTADKSSVRFEQIKGYDGEVVKMVNFENTTNAYENFLAALAKAGFTRGNKDPALANEKGYCPLGNRYIFELIQDGRNLERYWTTSCDAPRTYLGQQSLTIDLFEAQVPGYNDLTQGLDI